MTANSVLRDTRDGYAVALIIRSSKHGIWGTASIEIQSAGIVTG